MNEIVPVSVVAKGWCETIKKTFDENNVDAEQRARILDALARWMGGFPSAIEATPASDRCS